MPAGPGQKLSRRPLPAPPPPAAAQQTTKGARRLGQQHACLARPAANREGPDPGWQTRPRVIETFDAARLPSEVAQEDDTAEAVAEWTNPPCCH